MGIEWPMGTSRQHAPHNRIDIYGSERLDAMPGEPSLKLAAFDENLAADGDAGKRVGCRMYPYADSSL